MEHKKLEYPTKKEDKEILSKYEEVQMFKISPLQFLGLAAPIHWMMPENRYECNRNGETDCLKLKAKDADFIYRIRWNIDKIKKQSYVMDIPYLAVCHKRNGKIQVVAHEGRHRMVGAYLAGVEEVEIEIEHKFEDSEGYCRRWKGEKIIPITNNDIKYRYIIPEDESVVSCGIVEENYKKTLQELKFILTRKYKDPTKFKKGDIVSLTHRGLQSLCKDRLYNKTFCEKHKTEVIPINNWIVHECSFSGDYCKIRNPVYENDYWSELYIPVSHIILHKRGE